MSHARSLVVALSLLLAACQPASRVRRGALYTAGAATWDGYFRDVHAVQSAALQWVDAKRTARKPLCDELKLFPDAADATVSQLTHERVLEIAKVAGPVTLEIVGDEPRVAVPGGTKNVPTTARTLFAAIESTSRFELERARRMRATTTMIDRVLRSGRDLEPRVASEFGQKGATKTKEVQAELAASFDVLAPYRDQTQAMAQGAEDFVLDLKRAILTASGLPAPPLGASLKTKGARPASTKVGGGPPPVPLPPKPDAPAGQAEPPTKPKPKKPPAEEVFNP